MYPMDEAHSTMASQIAQVAREFEFQRTGRSPQSVSVVVGEDTLVISLHGALSPAEQALAQTPTGIAEVQEFHRQLFNSSSESLREKIRQITGVEVREARDEVEATTGTVVQVFSTGTVVQVFLMAGTLPDEKWNRGSRDNPSQATSTA
jgi:uncharacterized protein YbcI